MEKAMETSNKEEKLVIKCKVVRAFVGETKYDKKVANRITVFSEEMPYDEIWAYDECGAKYTPSWLKDANGYMNLKSNFDIDVQGVDGTKMSFDDWLEEGRTRGAEITIKVKQTAGAIYPVCIKVYADGDEDTSFDDM